MKIRIDRWPWVWAVLTLLLVAVVVTLAVALHASNQSNAATRRAAETAECVNNVLGARVPLAQADHDNEKQKIADQKVAVTDQENGLAALLAAGDNRARAMAGFELYQRGIDEFRQSLDHWVARDAAITKQKQLHPLGRC